MTTAREFTSRLVDLLRREQSAMADFLVALADFDRKKLWRDLGHASLFYYLHRELDLSAGPAHYRKTAAELIQRFPEIVEPLRDGRLCITSIVELARVMTPANRVEVLPRFFHASKQQAKAVAAEISPSAAVPRREVVTSVTLGAAERRTAVPPTAPPSVRRPATAHAEPAPFLLEETRPAIPSPAHAQARPTPAPLPAPSPAPRTIAEPLTANLRRLHVTVSKRFMAKLGAARDALSHAHPGADAEAILEAGLDLLLAQHAKRKGIGAKPRRSPAAEVGAATLSASAEAETSGNPDYIPAHVRREVWTRDEGRCQWPLESGGRCGSTQRVEFDHIVPRARGGASTAANLRLCCRFHNGLAARQAFGDAFMDRFAKARPPEARRDSR